MIEGWVEIVRPVLLRRAQSYDAHLAEDITQTALIRLHKEIDRFSGDRRELINWGLKSLKFAWYDMSMKRKPIPTCPLTQDIAVTMDIGGDIYCENFFVRLTPKQKSVLALLMQGYGVCEIAEIQGVSWVNVGKIRKRIQREYLIYSNGENQ